MEVTYTPPTDPPLLDPATLSQQLLAIIDQAVSRLSLLSDEEASLPYAPGKWSTKQVIGHLIDSAINNLARIVRLQSGPVELCIRVPRADPYIVSLLHDRDGNRKFGWMVDGIGFAGNPKLGWSKPRAASAKVVAGEGLTHLSIVLNYRRGLGVAPLRKR